MRKKLAIIGASFGQLPLCIKAHEMGIETYCFAWSKGNVCADYVDHYYPISIFEKDEIVRICKDERINGVLSNASETTALIASYVADKLEKNTTPYNSILSIRDKVWVREITNSIVGLSPVKFVKGNVCDIIGAIEPPLVLKPINGSAKKGVNFIKNINQKLDIDDDIKGDLFVVEEYIEGDEYSVESISYNNQHYVVQITEKISTGAPHFVELEHHQPAQLSSCVIQKIESIIPQILSAVGFDNGASHVEIKIDEDNNIYLIEVNPRGGGDYISNELVQLSTDCDYLKQMILVSLDLFQPIEVKQVAYTGIYFLSAYTSRLLPYFNNLNSEWLVRKAQNNKILTNSISNYDRDGYIIYKSDKKVVL